MIRMILMITRNSLHQKSLTIIMGLVAQAKLQQARIMFAVLDLHMNPKSLAFAFCLVQFPTLMKRPHSTMASKMFLSTVAVGAPQIMAKRWKGQII